MVTIASVSHLDSYSKLAQSRAFMFAGLRLPAALSDRRPIGGNPIAAPAG